MRFASLGSGSGGNATLVCCGGSCVLVDCGFGVRETERRLARLGLDPQCLAAILVTHEHTDHIRGVGALSRKYSLPVYMTPGTHMSRDYGRLPDVRLVRSYGAFTVGDFHIQPVAVPHDAREPAQYVLASAHRRLGILTDLGSITPHVVQAYEFCDSLLVEANHDLRMLAEGPYPPSLKARVSSAWGHLNNDQTANLLTQLGMSRLQHIAVGHISRKNNTVSRARESLAECTANANHVHYACQEQGFDWLEIN